MTVNSAEMKYHNQKKIKASSYFYSDYAKKYYVENWIILWLKNRKKKPSPAVNGYNLSRLGDFFLDLPAVSGDDFAAAER